jgi:hypothetical protein
MDELARPRRLDPADDTTASALEVSQPRDPVASPHGVQGRGRKTGPFSEAGGAHLMAPSRFDDPAFHLGRRLGRATSRPARTILEGPLATLEVATLPFVGGLAWDPERLGCRGHGPTVFDQTAQAESTFRGQWSVTVHSEPPWLCGRVDSSTLPRGLTSSGDSPRQQGPWAEHLGPQVRSATYVRRVGRCGGSARQPFVYRARR